MKTLIFVAGLSFALAASMLVGCANRESHDVLAQSIRAHHEAMLATIHDFETRLEKVPDNVSLQMVISYRKIGQCLNEKNGGIDYAALGMVVRSEESSLPTPELQNSVVEAEQYCTGRLIDDVALGSPGDATRLAHLLAREGLPVEDRYLTTDNPLVTLSLP